MSSDTAQPLDIPTQRVPLFGRVFPTKSWIAAGLSLATFSAVIALRATGHIYGMWVLVLFGLLLLLMPVSEHVSGRILWTLSILFGFVPLLWWIPAPWPSNSRSTGILAVGAAIAVFTIVRAMMQHGGMRRSLPSMRVMDLMPLMAAMGAVFVAWPALMVRHVEDAMALLLMAWDNASHFDIFHMQRSNGTVLPLQGLASDGSRWSFSDYPQGFHSALVMIAEIARPGSDDVAADIVTFTNFTAVMNVAIVVLVVAAVSSLPALREKPVVGMPAAVFVGAGWIFGPGALASMHGFSNFFFTAALVVAAIVLCQSMNKVFDPMPLLAVGSCTAAVMQNWVLLGIFLVPVVLAVLIATPQGRWRARVPELAVGGATVVLVLIAASTAASQLLAVKAEGILYAIGGVPLLDYGLLIVLLCAVAAAALALSKQSNNRGDVAARTQWSLFAVWLGLLLAVAMGIAQVAETGTLAYYMQKFSIALALIVVAAVAVTVNGLLDRQRGSEFVERRSSTRAVAISIIISLGLTQLFGFVFPLKEMGIPPTAESGVRLAEQHMELTRGTIAGPNLLRAVEAGANLDGHVMYLTTNPADIDAILAQQWFDGLRGNYTEDNWQLSLNMFPLSGGPANLPQVVEDIRAEDPEAHFIVDPENQATLDAILASTA